MTDLTLERHHEHRFKVYASSGDFPWTKNEARDRLRSIGEYEPKTSLAKINGKTIDYSWLRGAAETYRISPDIHDYLLTEVPIVTVTIPNRNLHCFPYDEVTYFDPRFGKFVYQTFIGKPTYADHCFPAGTMIRMINDERKSIENIKVGDEVLTDKLRYRKVTKVFENGIKSVWKFRVTGLIDPIEMTANHPTLVVDRRQVFGRYDEKNQVYRKSIRIADFRELDLKPHIRSASDIYLGDFLCVPITVGGTTVADKNFAFLAGAYLADGYLMVRPDYPDGYGIGYTIGKHETEFRDRIIESLKALGLNPCVYEDMSPNCTWIFAHNQEFSEQIFSCCGRYSEHKRLGREVRSWDEESIRTFLGGYMSGDGCFDAKKGSFRVRSSSIDLLKDLQQAFAFVGIPACIGIDAPLEKALARIKKYKKPVKIVPTTDSGYLRVAQSFIPSIKDYVVGKNIVIKKSLADSVYGIVSGRMLLLPVRSIERDTRSAQVFNFEVEEDHTYVANDIIVHNCNKNFTEAKGVHFDASLRKVPGWNIWKIYVLLGYDRTKDSALVRRIEQGERRGYSMGAWVSFFISSITGQIANSTQTLKYPVGSVVNGVLSYLNCSGVEYFETSSVGAPADISAESNQLWYF